MSNVRCLVFNVALGLSILVAILLPLGQRVLLAFVSPGLLLKSLGPFGTSLVVLFFKYFLVALVLYFIFRLAGVERRFKFSARGAKVVFVGNTLVVLYGLARAVASLAEGGGGSFVVAQFGMFVLWPAWLLIVVGLLLLVFSQKSAKPGVVNEAGTPYRDFPPCQAELVFRRR